MTAAIDIRPDHLKIVQDILTERLPAGASARAFGSRVKWTAKTHSDLDLSIRAPDALPSRLLDDLDAAFSESDLPFKVDVVDWNRASSDFRAIIEKTSVPLPWPTTTIGAIIERIGGSIKTGPFGTALKAHEYTEHGVPLISVGEVGNGVLKVHPTTPRISPEVIRRLPEYVLHSGDIVFSRKGAVERSALVAEDQDGWFLGSDGIRLRLGSPNAARFVSYALRTVSHRAWITQHSTGSTMASLNQGIVSRIPIPDPPPEEQSAIVAALSALDDKIELNRRMNETLEAMTRALFAQWSMATVHQAQRISVAQLQEAGVLAIGDGYRAKNQELGGAGLPFIRAGELKSGFDIASADILNENSVKKASDKRSRIGDVAFTSKGTVGRFARVTTHTPDFVYSPQICFWRSLDPMQIRPSILFMWMTSLDLRSQIDAVSGNTDMAPYVSLSDQKRMTLPVFGEEQHVLADQLDILLDKHAHNDFESRTLAATRDALLPKLMFGEIRLRGAEALAA